MKKLRYSLVLTAAYIALQIGSSVALAEEITAVVNNQITPTNTTTRVEEIVVTARRTAQEYASVPDNISVITSKELARMPVNDLAGALNLVTGVDIQSRGQFGQPSSVTIQGCDPRHVRVMVDGVLLNSQGGAFPDPSQIPIGNVDRIEIIKGAGSAMWGSSLGGVINVITKSPRGDRLFQGDITLSGGGGAYNFAKESLNFSGKAGNFGYMAWGDFLDSNDKFKPYGDVQSQKGSGKINYLISDQANLEASFNYNGASIGAYRFPDPINDVGQDLFYFTRYGSLKFTLIPNEQFEFNATAKASNQDSRIVDTMLSTDTVVRNVAAKDVFAGLDLQSKYLINDFSNVVAGVDVGRDKLFSDLMSKSEYLKRQGYYANYSADLGKEISVSAGGRYDDNEAYGNQFSPSAGAVYHLPVWQGDIRFTAAKAFNAPPLIYKYAGSPANPDLKAERALKSYELGADAKPVDDLSVKIGLYYAHIKDYVVYDGATNTFDNIGKIRRQGFETDLSYNIFEKLSAQAGCGFNRVIDLSLDKEVQALGVAKLTYNTGLNYSWDKLNLTLRGNYRFWNIDPLNQPKDRKFIWDLKANYDFSGDSDKNNIPMVFVAVKNIFNTKYWDDPLFPQAGRLIEVGAKYNF